MRALVLVLRTDPSALATGDESSSLSSSAQQGRTAEPDTGVSSPTIDLIGPG